ncbi:MAG TPA: heparin lyase I family protein [Dongiaceae bacterium]|nr:heparin lyase I family protein [Dongiaceae bacterium]
MGERKNAGYPVLRGLRRIGLAGGLIAVGLTVQGLSGNLAAWAADSRCPIVILPATGSATPDVGAKQDLPDLAITPVNRAGIGLYSRDSLADDFEQSKPAPFWDRATWLDPSSFTLTSTGVANGLRAMLLTVHHGDKEEFIEDKATGDRRCAERAQLGETSDYWPRLGDDLWYGFAFHLPADLPPIDRRLVLAQIKQVAAKRDAGRFSLADSTPALALRLREITNAKILCFYLTAGNDDMADRKPVAIVQLARPQAVGIWHNIVLHARLSRGKSADSVADWWFDDQPVPHISNKPVTVGYKDGGAFSAFRLGLYRDQAIKGSREIDQDWAIGYDAMKREIGYPGRPGDPLSESSVAAIPLDPPASLGDTGLCRRAFGMKS